MYAQFRPGDLWFGLEQKVKFAVAVLGDFSVYCFMLNLSIVKAANCTSR